MNCIDRKGVLTRPGYEPQELHEGAMAYVEAIEFLMQQKPVPALKQSKMLSSSAADHVKDVGPKGVLEQIGTGTVLLRAYPRVQTAASPATEWPGTATWMRRGAKTSCSGGRPRRRWSRR